MTDLNVYFISLEKSRERRFLAKDAGLNEKWVDDYFKAFDLTASSVNNFDFVKKSLDLDFFSVNYGRHISPPELGCSISHLSVCKEILDKKNLLSVVFEDDVIPVPNYQHALSLLLSQLSALDPVNNAFICHLGVPSHWLKKLVLRDVVSFTYGSVRMNSFQRLCEGQQLWWAHAYVISYAAAERIYHAESNRPVLADDWGLRREERLVDSIYVSPAALFVQRDGLESTVQNLAVQNTKDSTTKSFFDLFRARLLAIKKTMFRFIPYFVMSR